MSASASSAGPPPLLSDFGAPWEEGFLAEKAVEAKTFLDETFPEALPHYAEKPLVDVFGNEVRLCYGQLQEASLAGGADLSLIHI